MRRLARAARMQTSQRSSRSENGGPTLDHSDDLVVADALANHGGSILPLEGLGSDT